MVLPSIALIPLGVDPLYCECCTSRRRLPSSRSTLSPPTPAWNSMPYTIIKITAPPPGMNGLLDRPPSKWAHQNEHDGVGKTVVDFFFKDSRIALRFCTPPVVEKLGKRRLRGWAIYLARAVWDHFSAWTFVQGGVLFFLTCVIRQHLSSLKMRVGN